MNISRTSALALLGALAVAACQPAAPATLTDADRAALQAMGDQFAQNFVAGDIAAVGAAYTQDATLLPPNAPAVVGRDAITAFMGTFPPVTEMTLVNDVIEGIGDLVYVTGRYRMTLAVGEGVAVVDSGKYLDIRQRQADGTWLFLVDMFNSSIPLPAPPAPAP